MIAPSPIAGRHMRGRGFTLLEVVVVLGLFTIMMFALIRFFISYNTTYLFDRALATTASSAAAIVSETVTYTLPADQVIASHTFGSVTRTSGANTVVLELPSVDASGNILTNTYDYVAIYTSNGRVYRTLAADPTSSRVSGTKQLSDSIQALTFTYDNADFTLVRRVTVDVQTSISIKANVAQTHLKEQVYLRNFPT
jgi:prepilin-type N-terminal cleavage/methylation domain-containing protein